MNLSPDIAALLQGYSQLGIGFAGFAGVIGSFSRLRVHPQATAFRIRAMVVTGLATVIFSLIPFVFSTFGADDSLTWRGSTALAAVFCTGLLVVLARQVQVLYAKGYLKTQAITVILYGLAGTMILALYAAAFGFAGDYAAAIYLYSLFFAMILCSYYFLMLMIAVKLGDDE